jgi:ParB family chromosome partitioning protein
MTANDRRVERTLRKMQLWESESEEGQKLAEKPMGKCERRENHDSIASESTDGGGGGRHREVVLIKVDAIIENRRQPRQYFNEASIESLAATIHERGLLQPIIVRKLPEDEQKYEIIAGERRFRAVKHLGHTAISAVVRNDVNDHELAILALVENLQREELSIVEKVKAIAALKKDFPETDSVAKEIGVSRKTIERYNRINKAMVLSPPIKLIFEEHGQSIDMRTAMKLCEVAKHLAAGNAGQQQLFDDLLKTRSIKKATKTVLDTLQEKVHDTKGFTYKTTSERYVVAFTKNVETLSEGDREELEKILQNMLTILNKNATLCLNDFQKHGGHYPGGDDTVHIEEGA